MRRLAILLALVGAMIAGGGCGQTPPLEKYWAEVTPEGVLEDLEGAEEVFVEWSRRLATADSNTQRRSMDSLVELMGKDEVCAYIYTEWAINFLYGLWSPTRNEESFGYLLQRIYEEEALAPIRSAELRRIREMLTHNRAGSRAEDFVLYDTLGEKSTLHEVRGKGAMLLLLVDITCPSCIDIIAEVEKQEVIMEAARSGELALLIVAIGAHPEQLAPFAEEHKGSLWEVRGATRGALEGAYYDTDAAPCLVLIGTEGNVEVDMTRNTEALTERLKR